MRVLHLSSEGPWRGGEQQIAYLIDELKKKGIENHVAVKRDSAFEKWCQSNAIPATPLSFKNSLDFVSAIRLIDVIKEFRPDLIHIHSSKSHGIIALTQLFYHTSIPLILSRRVIFPIKNGFLNTRKYTLKNLKKIICVSDKVKDEVEKLRDVRGKTVTVHDGIDISQYAQSVPSDILKKEFKLSQDSYLVGNTSALTKEKDYLTFINVAERINTIQNKKVHFFIIGKGEEERSLRQYIKTKKHRDKIHFTGFVQNVGDYLKELDVFLFTSTSEGLGTSVLNAFATNTPVISTNVGGLPELISHQKTGLLSDPGDVVTLSEHLNRYIADPVFSKTIASDAYESLKEFSYTKMAAKTLEIYRNVLN